MKSRRTVKLILAGDFFSSLLFWTPIILTFLLNKVLSIEEALILISLTQIITLIVEYPTGVISDY
jgi:hypothetical protein